MIIRNLVIPIDGIRRVPLDASRPELQHALQDGPHPFALLSHPDRHDEISGYVDASELRAQAEDYRSAPFDPIGLIRTTACFLGDNSSVEDALGKMADHTLAVVVDELGRDLGVVTRSALLSAKG